MNFTKQQLEKRAKNRPTGYIEDVLSKATVDGDMITLADDDWKVMADKYRVKPFAPSIDTNSLFAKERFDICRQCPESTNDGFHCKQFKGTCCFGRWRTNINNDCPLGKWPKVEPTDKGIGG